MIVNEENYKNIIEILRKSNGLLFQCETELAQKFPDIPLSTLRAIISKHGQNIIKEFYSRNYRNTRNIVSDYDNRVKDEWTIVEMGMEMKVPPLCVCRMILNEKFSKNIVKEILKDPDIIKDDPMLSANVL